MLQSEPMYCCKTLHKYFHKNLNISVCVSISYSYKDWPDYWILNIHKIMNYENNEKSLKVLL